MKPQKAPSKVKRLLVAGAACVSGACATGPQLRPPPPEPCPAGASATHETYRLNGRRMPAELDGPRVPGTFDRKVKEGEMTARLISESGEFPRDTLLKGHLILGRGRVYLRFTEASLPRGESVPVCIEAYSTHTAEYGIDIIPGCEPESPIVSDEILVSTTFTSSFQ